MHISTIHTPISKYQQRLNVEAELRYNINKSKKIKREMKKNKRKMAKAEQQIKTLEALVSVVSDSVVNNEITENS